MNETSTTAKGWNLRRIEAGHHAATVGDLTIEVRRRRYTNGRGGRYPWAWNLYCTRSDGSTAVVFEHVDTLDGVRELLRALASGREVLVVLDREDRTIAHPWGSDGAATYVGEGKDYAGAVWFDASATPCAPREHDALRAEVAKLREAYVDVEQLAKAQNAQWATRCADLEHKLAEERDAAVAWASKARRQAAAEAKRVERLVANFRERLARREAECDALRAEVAKLRERITKRDDLLVTGGRRFLHTVRAGDDEQSLVMCPSCLVGFEPPTEDGRITIEPADDCLACDYCGAAGEEVETGSIEVRDEAPHAVRVAKRSGVTRPLVTAEGGIKRDRRYRIPAEVAEAIEACPRGSYQRGLLDGYRAWSGADLRGDAKRYSSHYARSRAKLVERIAASIAPFGWSAETRLVYRGSPRRLHRELVVTSPALVDFLY